MLAHLLSIRQDLLFLEDYMFLKHFTIFGRLVCDLLVTLPFVCAFV